MDKEMEKLLKSGATKLKKAMDEGPEGKDVVLTPAEATVIYRVLGHFMDIDKVTD